MTDPTPAPPRPSLTLEGVDWYRDYSVPYSHYYDEMMAEADAAGGQAEVKELIRYLVRNDLWFICYFILRIPAKVCNNKFWADACYEVDVGPRSNTLDLWARFHGKSSIITAAEPIQRIAKNPEERICIFSWKQSVALTFLRQIKVTLETSRILHFAFPEIFYANPQAEAPKWAEEAGLIVKRRSLAKEPTLMAAGLIDSAPTGFHFTGRIYDDIMTAELARTPDQVQKVKESFDMSQNLKTGTDEDWQRIVGTPYHHDDVLAYIESQRKDDNTPVYETRKKPATEGGEWNGKSVLLPEDQLAVLRVNKRAFASQQLLKPELMGELALDPNLLREVAPSEIPKNLFRFMTVDPAGERKSDGRQGDSWALCVAGVAPFRDDIGASDVYILDLCIQPMTEAEAITNVVQMFLRNGLIRQIGIEKVGISTAEIHIAKALHAKGRALTIDNKGLVVLRPAGREKTQRIEAALSMPMQHGKLYISTAIPAAYRERLRLEMKRFPMWHDDGLDAVSYVYDMVRDYRFGLPATGEQVQDKWDRAFRKGEQTNLSWLYV